ncbi:MAG: DoxX family protein [Myxococcales bacterium]|nr:DoxX family protein [Myxococcales bacterium]MCB9649720.1 DoxX family protein [Deltaproteobacteria bacterium]
MSSSPGPSRGLHITLWVLQVLLGIAFFATGFMKLVVPAAELAEKMTWVRSPIGFLLPLIGAVEALGGLGLILPSVTRIMPKLTPLAALGLVIVMVGAMGTHVALGEYPEVTAPLVFAVLCGFVGWGRWKKAPIAAR